jgi:hypothetical protein
MTVVVENNDGRWDNGSTYSSAPYAGNVVPYKLLRYSISDDGFATAGVVMATMFVTEIDAAIDQWLGEATISASSTMMLLEQASVDNWERPAPAPAEQEADGNQDDAAPVADVAAGVVSAHATTDADHERYQQVLSTASISELSLPANIDEKLTQANVLSIWHLEQLRAEISQGRAEWPKGIGEAKVTRIEDALMNWMSRNIDALSGPATEADAADDHDTLDL